MRRESRLLHMYVCILYGYFVNVWKKTTTFMLYICLLLIPVHTDNTCPHCTQTHLSFWRMFTLPASLITAAGVMTAGHRRVYDIVSPLLLHLLRNKNMPSIWFTVSPQHIHNFELTNETNSVVAGVIDDLWGSITS